MAWKYLVLRRIWGIQVSFQNFLAQGLVQTPCPLGVRPDSSLWTLAFFPDSSRYFPEFPYVGIILLYFLLFFLNMSANLSNVVCPLRQEPWPTHLSVPFPTQCLAHKKCWVNACWVKERNWEERSTCKDVLPRGLLSRTYMVFHRRQTPGQKNREGGQASVLKISSLYLLSCFPTN